LVMAFVAGTFIEHMSMAISLFCLYWCGERVFNSKKIPRELMGVTLAHLMGTLLLFFSVGNFVKATTYEHALPLSDRILNNFRILNGFSLLGGVLVLFWLLALTNNKFVASIKSSVFWKVFFMAVVCFLAFTILPTEQLLNYRRAFPFEIFIILGITVMASYAPRLLMFEVAIMGVVVVNIWGNMVTAFNNSSIIFNQVNVRMEYLQGLSSRGKDQIVVDQIKVPGAVYNWELINKYTYISDITPDENSWLNTCYATALGIKTIKLNPGQIINQ
jgi:hypothetical protein